MDSPDDPDELAPRIRTVQFINLFMALGVSFFLLLVIFVLRAGRLFAPDPWNVRSVITLLALAWTPIALVGSQVMRKVIGANQLAALARGEVPRSPRTTGDPGGISPSETANLFDIYQTEMIVGLAMIEGAAFFAVIAYFLEGKAPALIAALVLLACLILGFPTRPRVEDWMGRRRLLLEERRQLGA